MSEMLGNQYFMARNYARAAEELEQVLIKDPANKPVRRKLIICFNQTGNIRRALEIFLSLIKDDIDFIINTDPVDDDCPCPELVYDLEKQARPEAESVEYHLKLGMLWLYCDLRKSIEHFEKAGELEPDNPDVKKVLTILKTHHHAVSE